MNNVHVVDSERVHPGSPYQLNQSAPHGSAQTNLSISENEQWLAIIVIVLLLPPPHYPVIIIAIIWHQHQFLKINTSPPPQPPPTTISTILTTVVITHHRRHVNVDRDQQRLLNLVAKLKL